MGAIAATLEYAVPAEVAFRYLSDPRNRPEWQSSLLSVEVPPDEEPHLGQAWRERTAVGVRPHMETTELTPFRTWTERGSWRGVTATLTLHFTDIAGGCRVRAEGEVSGRGIWSVPAGAAGLLASTAIAADLRKAGRILASRSSQ
ncbi:Polyketide cyclase / dehydrase and lipid transport [Nocardioides exalbidus]|uniref:Polyketide cyclase / dehydrase and lipid transport n=1 Tax=Nocardioides exalbidus TaxID=402596 RepID=A0A1H4LVL3_9ACTN|nr:SRPBCC family protein [Nocardioides exalbidus]SEB74315.1 Polyketide cyclase / dehydrase and lipid transport [Nocardioides exalbidus]